MIVCVCVKISKLKKKDWSNVTKKASHLNVCFEWVSKFHYDFKTKMCGGKSIEK